MPCHLITTPAPPLSIRLDAQLFIYYLFTVIILVSRKKGAWKERSRKQKEGMEGRKRNEAKITRDGTGRINKSSAVIVMLRPEKEGESY